MTSKQRISITFVPAGQQAMHERLENWGRWADVRQYYTCSPMFRLYRSNSRQWQAPEIKPCIDILDAAKVEKAVTALPEPHRKAIVWFYIIRSGELQYRRKEGLTLEALNTLVLAARMMLINRLTK